MRRLRPALISEPLAPPSRQGQPSARARQWGVPRWHWRCPACLFALRSHRKRSASPAIQRWCGSPSFRSPLRGPHRRRPIPQRRDAEMSCRRTAAGGAAKRRRVYVPSEPSRGRACTAAGLSRQRARREGSDPKGATGRFSAAAGSPPFLFFATVQEPPSFLGAPAPHSLDAHPALSRAPLRPLAKLPKSRQVLRWFRSSVGKVRRSPPSLFARDPRRPGWWVCARVPPRRRVTTQPTSGRERWGLLRFLSAYSTSWLAETGQVSTEKKKCFDRGGWLPIEFRAASLGPPGLRSRRHQGAKVSAVTSRF
jgi:hypothetical protein